MLKKVIVLMCSCVVFSSLWAQDETMEMSPKTRAFDVSALLGVSESSQKLEGSKWANTGVTMGVQLMSPFSETISLGLELTGTDFARATSSESWSYREWNPYAGGYVTTNLSETDKVKTRVTNLMLAGRVNLNPQDPQVRLYIPMGIGLARNEITIDYAVFRGNSKIDSGHVSSSGTGFAWYLGGGFEINLRKNWTLGFEGRYNQFHLKIEDIEGSYNPHYFTGAVRLSYHFTNTVY